MPVHGCQRLGFGKAMGTGGKTMVKKTGTALEAMGRCRKLFWIFFFRWDFFRGHPPAASMEGLSCGNLEGCGETWEGMLETKFKDGRFEEQNGI